MSFRRKPESRVIDHLQTFWTPVFIGVTTFYEFINVRRNLFSYLVGAHMVMRVKNDYTQERNADQGERTREPKK